MILSTIIAVALGQCVSTGPTGALGPGCATEVGGLDSTGKLRSMSVSTGGVVSANVNQVTDPWVVAPWIYGQDAFGAARVSTPTTLLDLTNRYGRDARLVDAATAGGGTVTDVTAESAIRLTVAGTSGDQARARTNVWWHYQAGRGQRIYQTVYLSANAGADADQTVRWGYFDDNDGLFWQRAGGITSFCRRTSVSGSAVNNCTAITLPAGADLTKASIYEIGFQWLGSGTVRAWWNGTLVFSSDYSNTIGAPFTKTANLPVSWEIINSAAADAATLTIISASVTSEGGQDAPEFGFSAERTTALTVSTTNLPLISIRLASTFNGVDNRRVVLPIHAHGINAQQPAILSAYLNPSLTGASFAAASATSGVEVDTTATAVTGGDLIGSCYLPDTASTCIIDFQLFFNSHARRVRRSAFAGTSDIVTVVSRRTGVVDASVQALIEWWEVP